MSEGVFRKDGKFWETYYHERNSNRISHSDGYRTRQISAIHYWQRVQQRAEMELAKIEERKNKGTSRKNDLTVFYD